jgi:plastocyanin
MRNLLIASLVLATLIVLAGLSTAAYGQEVRGTFVVRIPPGAAQGTTDHYVPANIAIPAGTTIVWFNDDPDQLHTITSGDLDDENAGSEFDSSVINEGTFFQHTFDEAGEYMYHCEIHPGMVATVSVSDETDEGENFVMHSGTGSTFDFTEHERTLLYIEPTSDYPEDEPITYQLSILKDGDEVFSEEFRTLGGHLYVELVPTDDETQVTGPDISDPLIGAYHIQGSFLKEVGSYTVRAEITQLFDQPPEEPIADDFGVQIVPEFPFAALAAAVGVAGTVVYSRIRGYGRKA